jgi:pimeloyl-ACP methyl ester carboxylesterase
MIQYLLHNRIRLALHRLKEAPGRPLLLLHGLGESSPVELPPEYADWPGPVHALDFTGHGKSTVPPGGGYTCELLMADTDAALAALGEATIVGRGLGAYIALLLSGARPTEVRGVILLDGSGLAGGGASDRSPYIPVVDTQQLAPPDPFAIADLATDARPPSYATSYALLAEQESGLVRPVMVCAREHPEWMMAVINALGIETSKLSDAIDEYRKLPYSETA